MLNRKEWVLLKYYLAQFIVPIPIKLRFFNEKYSILNLFLPFSQASIAYLAVHFEPNFESNTDERTRL